MTSNTQAQGFRGRGVKNCLKDTVGSLNWYWEDDTTSSRKHFSLMRHFRLISSNGHEDQPHEISSL